jgi:hypothetical protein
MKGHVVLALLCLLVSCGKSSSKSEGSSSSSSNAAKMQFSGLSFETDLRYGILVISCSDVASVTNSQKLNSLTAYRSAIASDSTSSTMYAFGSGQASPYQMNNVLTLAIQSLQYADPASINCPKRILANSY